MLAKLVVPAWVLAALLVANGCDDGTAHRRLVRGSDVVREFKAHGIVLQNTHLFGDKNAPSPPGIESFYACNAATNVASRRVKQKTGAELVGYIELAHHSGQTLAEKWRVTRENWLRRKS